MEKFTAFARIAEIEFADIVLSTQNLGHKLRIYLKDKSFIDFFYTSRLKSQRFSIHWERIHIDNTIYRLDNTPDRKWKYIKTFPVHFHNKKYSSVTTPPFQVKEKFDLQDILRNFLIFSKVIVEKKQNKYKLLSSD